MSSVQKLEDVYEDILSGRRRNFSSGTWPSASNAARVIRYLVEEKLNWSREDILSKFNGRLLREYKLGGMLGRMFNNSVYAALNTAYPNQFKPWELADAPRNFWSKDENVEQLDNRRTKRSC